MRKQLLVMTILLTLAFSSVITAEEITPSITVQGTGRVTVTPDLGTISFGVTQEGPEAGEVQSALAEQANLVKDAVLEAGLPEEQFSTAGIQLYPEYDYSSGSEKLTGYRGQISMTINEISVDEIGTYLKLLSDNGVNQVDGIRMFYSGYEEAYREALGKAMQQAREKAETLAAAENAAVTDRFTVTEGGADTSLRGSELYLEENSAKAMYDAADMDAGSGLDYSVGTTEVQANITVCYQIENADH